VADLETAREAMGMPWADWQGVKDAVPPAMTEYIGAQLRRHLEMSNA
jgi:DNA (cytosine-5)-methyltransferase 1